MDNHKNPENQSDNSWMDELLPPPELGEELGPDEQAVHAAGLIHPADAELERIIAETKTMERAAMPEETFWDDPFLEGSFGAPPAAEAPEAEQASFFDAPVPETAAEEAPAFEAPLPEAVAAQVPAAEVPEEPILNEIFPEVPASEEAAPEAADEEETLVPVWDRPFEPDIFGDTAQNAPEISDAAQTAQEASELEDYLPDEPPAEEFLPDEAPAIFPENMEDAYSNADPDMEEVPQAQEPAEEEAPVRKVRPRMKKGYGLLGIPHILSTVIWLAITVAIGVSLGRTLWVCAADVLAFGREEATYTITITDSDNIETIAAKLKNAGLIKYPGLFELYAGVAVEEGEISPGTYTLSSLYDYHALVKSMNQYSSVRQTVEVVIPEGYTCAQIFQLLEESGVCTAAELEDYAVNGELKDYWFLEGVDRSDRYCLEGYLFPDTYEFYVDDTPGRVLGKLLGDNVGGFEVRFTELMQEKLVTLNERLAAMMKKNGYDQAYIDEHQVTIREVVIVASMVEKESTGADAYDIASVIYNRLTNAKDYPYLNIDATIIYALGGNVDPETGKTMALTAEDLQLDSPYNSYLYKGLIPGPIANPGTTSLLAALDPNDTKYYYYVYDYNAGVHLFGKNAKEHEKNVAAARSED